MISLGHELLFPQVQAVKAQLVAELQARKPAEAAPLVLDCAALRTVDAAGLQLLVLLAMALNEHGTALQLQGCPTELRQRIQAVALQDWFSFDIAEAA